MPGALLLASSFTAAPVLLDTANVRRRKAVRAHSGAAPGGVSSVRVTAGAELIATGVLIKLFGTVPQGDAAASPVTVTLKPPLGHSERGGLKHVTFTLAPAVTAFGRQQYTCGSSTSSSSTSAVPA